MKPYKIIEKIQETPEVVSLKMVDLDGGHADFIAGQYVTILLPELNVPSGKAYSLSSIPSDPFLQITVKKLGKYSSRIHELKVGDEILVSEPYGFLNPEFDDIPMAMIAGGVGIVPIMSILRDALAKNPNRKIELWYSNQTFENIVFREKLESLTTKNPNFSVRHFLTKQSEIVNDSERVNYKNERIDVGEILATGEYDPESFFFICGRENFVGDMWRGLVAGGIAENKIATEAFF